MSNETQNLTPDADATAKDYKIEIEGNEPFDFVEEGLYVTSNDLCAATAAIFREIYEDFYGASFEVIPNTNVYTLSLYFDHYDHTGITAVSKDAGTDDVKNNTLRSTRRHWRHINEGDRYQITEAGKQLKQFLFSANEARRNLLNGNDAKWDVICTEVAEPSTIGVSKQLTKISYISPVKIVEAIYGKEVDGDQVEYNVDLKRSVPTFSMGGQVNNFILRVSRIKTKNIMKLAEQCGIQMQQNGLNIIR